MVVTGLCLGVLAVATAAASQQRGGGPAPIPTTGTSFIAGQVVEAASGKPVPGARVTIQSNRGFRPETVFADPQGRFYFANLPAGSYTADAAMAGYQASVTIRPTVVADGERQSSVRVKLVKLGSLAGTVRDEAGDPATGTEVFALRRTLFNGRPEWARSSSARVDDRGIYRLTGLRPGEYLVCACTRDPIPFDGVLLTTIASEPVQLLTLAARAIKQGSDVAGLDGTLRTYPPTLYPNSTTIAQAERVVLASGQERADVDIAVAAVRAARISGVLTGATGPTTARFIRLAQANESADTTDFGSVQPMLVQPDGRFDFAGVPPGQYVLKVNQPAIAEGTFGPSGAALALVGNRGGPEAPARISDTAPPYWAAEPITVSGDDVRGLSVVLRPGPRIAGRIEFQGASPPPPPDVLAKSMLGFLSLAPEASSATARIAGDSTFAVPGVLPGPYSVSARMTIPGWTVRSVTVAGVDLTDLPFDVAARDVTDILVTVTDAPPTALSGTVTGAALPLADDLSVLIFPADRRYWTSPSAAVRRFRQAAIAQTGTFTVQALAPGEYFVIAVPDDEAVEWQDARKLEVFARTAQRVILTDGGKASVTLRK